MQNATTVAGGNGQGSGLNQLGYLYGLYVDDDQTIYVTDFDNHRVVEWKKGATTGRVVAGGNGEGNRSDQLNLPFNVVVDRKNDDFIISQWFNRGIVRWPRKKGTTGQTIISNIDCRGLAIDDDGYLYVSVVSKDEVRRFKTGDNDGTIVAGGNGRGNRLDQLNNAFYVFVDQNQSVYIADSGNHRVIKWVKGAQAGVIVAGGEGEGSGMRQFSSPDGVIVDHLGTVYVADEGNNRVMRWMRGAKEGTLVVGGNGRGEQTNQLSGPHALSFDQRNNLYVSDIRNYRVQRFDINSFTPN